MRRGEIWVGNLNPRHGAEVGKIRPVLIVQADFLIAQGEPTVIVLPLTTQVRRSKEPLRVTIPARERLEVACQVMPEQLDLAIDRAPLQFRRRLRRLIAKEQAPSGDPERLRT